jgi:hypothetical protein
MTVANAVRVAVRSLLIAVVFTARNERPTKRYARERRPSAISLPRLQGDRGRIASDGTLAGIGKKIDAILANCRLPAEADANLHVILMDIMAGSEAMQGKQDGVSPTAGAQKIAHAYSSHFDHQGWKGLH